MSTICILITSEYPYKTQETFLEDEIPFLSAAFDRILIISLDSFSDEPRRPVPENVQIIPIGRIARTSRLRLPAYVLNGLIHKPFFHEKTGSLKKFLMKTYISGKSQSEYSIILPHLKEILQPDDRICIYSYWFFDHAMIACRLKKQLRMEGRFVMAYSRGHGYDIYSERNAMNYNPYQKPMISMLDGLYTCSEYGCRYLTEKYGAAVCSGKVYVSRLGTLDRGLSRQTDFSAIHFVTCSHLSELKRVDLFARAFVLMNKQIAVQKEKDSPFSAAPNLLQTLPQEKIHWTCIGSGVQESQIHAIIRAAGLEKQVTFTGRISHEEVMTFYRQHEITFFINVSTTEGVPVSIMEAQSFGIPVIATDVGGTSEIVDNDNGRLIPAAISDMELCRILLEECQEANIRKKQDVSRKDWEINSSAATLYNRWCKFLAESLQG